MATKTRSVVKEAKQSLVLSSGMNVEKPLNLKRDETVATIKTNSTLSKNQALKSNALSEPTSKNHFSIMSGIGFLTIFGFTIIILALYAMVKAVKVIADYKINLQ